MKKYIKEIIINSDLIDLIDNSNELIEMIGINEVRNMLLQLITKYYSIKIHSTYNKYAHCNSGYRYSIMGRLEPLISSKVDKILFTIKTA